MANLNPNVSVALGMNAKLSRFFKNAKNWFNKDFYAEISDFFKKPKKPTLAGFFTHFYGGLFAGFMDWVFWVGFFVPTLLFS